jgi:hypothetical protein
MDVHTQHRCSENICPFLNVHVSCHPLHAQAMCAVCGQAADGILTALHNLFGFLLFMVCSEQAKVSSSGFVGDSLFGVC